jgi:hypothetical protein
MKAKMESKYLPVNYEQLVYEDMLRWSQSSRISIDYYTEKFHELTVCSRVIEIEPQTLACYLNGMRGDIRREMSTDCVFSVEEAYQLALQL